LSCLFQIDVHALLTAFGTSYQNQPVRQRLIIYNATTIFYNQEQEINFMSTELPEPPLGLKPQYIHGSERVTEIEKAVIRYMEHRKQLPMEWIGEYNELIEKEENRTKNK
jgi:hypothetical protein